MSSMLPNLPAFRATIVTSPFQEDLRNNILANAQAEKLTMAIQEDQLGTGDAVKAAMPLSGAPDKVLILFGDTPLMRPEVLKQMVEDSADLTLLGFNTDTPEGYGRIICEDGKPVSIVEHKDADAATRRINLCNGGALAINAALLPDLLNGLENNNAQSEYYLPDIVGLANKQNINISLVRCQQRIRWALIRKAVWQKLKRSCKTDYAKNIFIMASP